MNILVLSDIHANIDALKAILQNVKNLDEVIILGDLVDYGPDPDLVVDFVRSHGFRIVMCNHDFAAAFNEDCRCGTATKDLSVYTRKNITLRKLSGNDLKYLASLPKTIELDTPLGKALCIHATPRDPLFKYLYPWATPSEIRNEVLSTTLKYNIVLLGHSHHQYLRSQRGTWIANPGSVGQPRDGDPRAPALILSNDSIEFIRIKYDVDSVVKKLKELIADDAI